MGHRFTVSYLVLLLSGLSTAAIAAQGAAPYLRSSLYVPVRDGTRKDAEVISRGKLLASRRKLGSAPYDTGGAPYPTQLEADAQPITPDEPIELALCCRRSRIGCSMATHCSWQSPRVLRRATLPCR
jgi:hypothetical protein